MTNPVVADLLDRSNRLGADPRNTNYAGGNTSAKGTETDPVTGQPVELLWVKGSGGDLGTLTEPRPRRAAAGPAALAGRRLPGRRARGRDGRRLRLLPARPRAAPRRRSTPRCTGWSGPRTSTTCTPTPASRWRPRPTARQLTRECFGDRVVWVPWRRPGLPAGPGHRRDRGEEPAGDRLHPRRPRRHRLGRDQRGSARPTRWRSSGRRSASSPSAAGPSRSAPALPGFEALPDAERRIKAAALAPVIRGLASHRQAAGRPLHRQRRRPRLPGRDRAPAAGRAGHVLPRPLPAHQGAAAGRRPAGVTRRSRTSSRG